MEFPSLACLVASIAFGQEEGMKFEPQRRKGAESA
jgi:hypothetical protein